MFLSFSAHSCANEPNLGTYLAMHALCQTSFCEERSCGSRRKGRCLCWHKELITLHSVTGSGA